MPVSDRDYIRGKHPPTCTCKECTDRRLRMLRKEVHPKGVGIPNWIKIVVPIFLLIVIATVAYYEGYLSAFYYTETPTPAPAPIPAPVAPASEIENSDKTPDVIPTQPPITQQELVEHMLNLINNDREQQALDPVILGSNSAAQQHAEEMLTEGYFSHWGLDGMKPYMRYTLAGGFNYEHENLFSLITNYEINLLEELNKAEKGLMNSPGHRVNILDKWHKKVNIGIAYDKENLYLVQQFEGDYVIFDKLPTLSNDLLSFSGEMLENFKIDQVNVWYDQLPHPLTLGQLAATYAYTTGSEPAVFIMPPAPPGSYYASSVTTYSYEVPLDPYEVSPDAPVKEPSPFSVQIRPVPFLASSQVRVLEAKYWDILGKEFSITANLSDIILEFGDGVYTVLIWGEKGDESIRLTNYTTWVQ